MRFTSYLIEDRATCGVRIGDRLVEAGCLTPGAPSNLVELIGQSDALLAELREAAEGVEEGTGVAASEAVLLPALPRPGKFLCLGLNFRDHAAEGGFEIPSYPALFLRAATSLVADGEPLVRPKASETFDYEAELAVVIGRRTRHASPETALQAVFGYTLFNDASVRAYQRKTPQWTIGKNFDGTGALGPDVVTADELPPGAAGLAIRTQLNGEVMQDSTTADMIFPVADAVSILSEAMTLEPGDVIAMGTPAGVGHARKPPIWMKPGDVCEITITGLGRLRNPVVDEADLPPDRAAAGMDAAM